MPQQLLAQFRSLPPAVKVAAAGALVVLVVVSFVVGIFSHQARLPLFATALRPEQATEVEERLAEWNVPFSESAGNVLVDSARRNDVLLRLSLAGVPHAHVATTSEALASVGVLTPEAVVDAQTRAGLAGDIEIGLRGVRGVDDARVIIAPAKVAQFGDQSSADASASVRLRLHPGATPTASAVAGIRAFVAASVAGLDPSRVTILDDRGVALGTSSTASDDASDLEKSLQSALDATLGAGAALVRVRAEVDRAAVERRDVRRASLGSPPIVREDSGESYADAGKHYEKHSVHTDRGSDVSEVVSRDEGGRIVRISTAVYVDRSRAVDLGSVRALAAATVGFDARRGDTLAVQTVEFPQHVVPKRDGWWLAYNALVSVLPPLVIAIGVVFAMRLLAPGVRDIVRAHVERRSIVRTSQSVAGFTPSRVRGALAHEPPHAAAAIISALPAATAAAVLELYPPHEREAIVRRMQRPNASVIPNLEEILGRHA